MSSGSPFIAFMKQIEKRRAENPPPEQHLNQSTHAADENHQLENSQQPAVSLQGSISTKKQSSVHNVLTVAQRILIVQ